MPLQWIKRNNDAFLVDLTADEGRALEVLGELQRDKTAELANANKVVAKVS
jgi:hypothetical protein